jgi:hypothetical protein
MLQVEEALAASGSAVATGRPADLGPGPGAKAAGPPGAGR